MTSCVSLKRSGFSFFFFLAAFAFFSGILSEQSQANPPPKGHCDTILRELAFADLEEQAAKTTAHGTVNAPYWFNAALPEGAHWVVTPPRDTAVNRIQKEHGPDFVSIGYRSNFEGRTVKTTLGISPLALADNINRGLQGTKKLFIAFGMRFAQLFTHGGGTKGSTHQNGSSNHIQINKRHGGQASYDYLGHGVNVPPNTPHGYPARPMAYLEYPLHLAEAGFDSNTPMLFTGHSMGGEIASLIQAYLTPQFFAERHPNLPVKGVVMLSPPVDHTRGGNLYQKISTRHDHLDPLEEERGENEKLFDSDNVNLRATEPLTDIMFLLNSNPEVIAKMKRDGALPGFAAMGDCDDVCYKGLETIYHEAIDGRPNTESHIYTDVVDFNGEPTPADHMITKYQSNTQLRNDVQGVGKTMPIALMDQVSWVERKILGNENFDPLSKEALNLNNVQVKEGEQIALLLKDDPTLSEDRAREMVEAFNAERAYRGAMSVVLANYAKNPVFRQFIENFVFHRLVTVSPALSNRVNDFLKQLGAFQKESERYNKFIISKGKAPFAEQDANDWAVFFKFFRIGDQGTRKETLALAQRWATSVDPARNFGAAILRTQLGEEHFSGIQTTATPDLPLEFPVHLQAVAQKLADARDLASSVAGLKSQIDTLLGFRDFKINLMVEHYPELRSKSDAMTRLTEELSSLNEVRTLKLNGGAGGETSLVLLHSQHSQMKKLFEKDGADVLARMGSDIEQLFAKTPDLDSPRKSFEEAVVQYKNFLRYEDEAKSGNNDEPQKKVMGWKTFSFESYMGPEIRSLFSLADKRYAELKALYARPLPAKEKDIRARKESIANKEENFLNTWNKTILEMTKLRDQIAGCSNFERVQSPHLNSLKSHLHKLREEALDLNGEFHEVRANFIKENWQKWSLESRPLYPQKYYDLIELYEAKQAEYQKARHEYDLAQKSLAVKGELGPYLEFIYSKHRELEVQMDELSGSHTSPSPNSLTGIEKRIQEIKGEMEKTRLEVARAYLSPLYRMEQGRAWDILNNPDERPSINLLIEILTTWNSLWRDPTGGAVSDSTAY